MKILMFLLISIASSVIFLGCHVITSYSADPKQFINRPIIMHRKPWLGTIAGITSILVFITLPINGWFIAKWLGFFSLPIFWFAATNPTVSFLLKYEKGKKYLLIRNPFVQVMFGGTAWIILTILNLIIL